MHYPVFFTVLLMLHRLYAPFIFPSMHHSGINMYFRTRAFLYRCLTCQQHFKGSGRVCSLCISELPWLHLACYRCGLPLKTQDHSLCRLCRDQNQNCLAKRSLFCFSYIIVLNHMNDMIEFSCSYWHTVRVSSLRSCSTDFLTANVRRLRELCVVYISWWRQ
jgi:predicted amidophosphoribosyltransferase